MEPDYPIAPIQTLASLVSEKVARRKEPNRPYVGLEDMTSGSADLASFSRSDISISTNSVFEKGDVLFGKLRPNLRKSIVAPFGGYCSTDILVLRPRPGADPGYVGHLFRSAAVAATAVRTAIGTRMPRTSWADLAGVHVFGPDVDEQRLIADILDTVDDAIRRGEQLIAKLELIKQGLLHDLLTRGIDENGQLRDRKRRPEQFKDSAVGRVPREWDVQAFGEIALSTVLGSGVRGADLLGDNLNLLKMGNLGWGFVDVAEVEQVARARVPDWPGLVLKRGDLLFNTRNTPDLVGKTAAWGDGLDKDTISDNNILRARFDDRANGEFVAACMANGEGRRRLGQLATGTTSVAAIYWRNLRRYLLPVPPREEQDEIMTLVHESEHRLRAENAVLRKLRSLRVGLAHDLLTGKVRVTQLLESDAA